MGKPACHRGGRWAPPSGTLMPAGTDETVSRPHDGGEREHVWQKEKDVSFAMCMPALTNWIKLPVDRKGSARVRLTYEEDWHCGWERQICEDQMCLSSQPRDDTESEETLLTHTNEEI